MSTTTLHLEHRFADALPELALTRLSGRIGLRRSASETILTGQSVSLEAADGVRIAPTDLRLGRQGEGAGHTFSVAPT